MRPEHPDQCPICGNNLGEPIPESLGDFCSVRCKLCGEFRISIELFEDLKSRLGDLRPYLAAATRQASAANEPLALTSANWRELAEAHKLVSIPSKLDKLLLLFRAGSKHFGSIVTFRYDDYPLIDAASHDERVALLNHAIDSGYLYNQGDAEHFKLTPKGWEYLEPSSASAGIRGRVFVAMSFEEALNEAWELGIKAAIERDCGLRCIRIDEGRRNQKICDKILAEIRRCQFVVADYTHQKAGVYFEDGYAMGLGRQVIRCCRKDEMEEGLHFDTLQYPYIPWTTYQDLREQLADRLQALIRLTHRV